jgi:glycosyltransferase involved in cell wall biosynthesis
MPGTTPKRNPRLLIVTRTMDVGGTERHLAQIAPGLVQRGFDVTLYCIAKEGGQLGALAGTDVRLTGGAPLSTLSGLGFATTMLTSALGLIPEMLLHRPDIAHFFLPHAVIAGSFAAALTQIPVRVMSRRCQNHYQAKRPRLARLEHALHGSMTAVLGNSQTVLDELVGEEGVAPERAGLIYNGVDLAAFSAPCDRAATRAALGIAAGATVIATLANLGPVKGHADLLAGLAMIRQRLPKPWHLLAIGHDGGTQQALRAQAAALGLESHIHWLGRRRDIADLLHASDIGVLASHEEGFSNAIVESMAAGLPMVVTNVGGNAEAVLHGETGLVVPARAPDQLGAALAQLATDASMARDMGRRGRQRAAAEFSLTACLDSYEQLYRSLLTGQGVPRDLRGRASGFRSANAGHMAGEVPAVLR